MSHAVESMMYTGQVPWHGLGTPVSTEATASDAIKLAGLSWKVDLQPVFAGAGLLQTPVVGMKATVRDSDHRALGVVGDRYMPVQNEDAFTFFDSVVGEGQAIYHTAGSLDGGRRVWFLAKLPGEVRLQQDEVTEKYLLLMNSHDGSTALRMLFTPVRVVCQNTLNLALRGAAADGIAIRHTASATTRIDQARRALGLANEYYANFSVEAARLMAAPYADTQMRGLVEMLFPGNLDELSARTQHHRQKVLELFEYGQGHARIRGTAWAALNAVAEFADHNRSPRVRPGDSRDEKRLSSIWLGSSAVLKRAAHEAICSQLAA
jgi:phage/plasmid-like protein (TIGR03299 family)